MLESVKIFFGFIFIATAFAAMCGQLLSIFGFFADFLESNNPMDRIDYIFFFAFVAVLTVWTDLGLRIGYSILGKGPIPLFIFFRGELALFLGILCFIVYAASFIGILYSPLGILENAFEKRWKSFFRYLGLFLLCLTALGVLAVALPAIASILNKIMG